MINHIDPTFLEKLRNIKLLATDCDGVMTDGGIWWAGEEVGWAREFCSLDGHGLRKIKNYGFQTALITGGDSKGLKIRAKMLHFDYEFYGKDEKLPALQEIIRLSGVNASEIAYIGDDDIDLPVLCAVGAKFAVPGAVPDVLKRVDYITKNPGGRGAVREVVELLIGAKEKPL